MHIATADCSGAGSLFHMLGPATANDLSSSRIMVDGVTHIRVGLTNVGALFSKTGEANRSKQRTVAGGLPQKNNHNSL